MHHNPFSKPNERRVEPSDRAKAAMDRWLAANGGEDAIKRRMAAPPMLSTSDLDAMAARWRASFLSKGADKIRADLAHERARQLRRARRQLRLAIVVSALATGTALALVVFYGILGYH